ncbi:unnamed protein product [Effrenium voratum]|nr:unnamed protein product [Effrenium voratum]
MARGRVRARDLEDEVSWQEVLSKRCCVRRPGAAPARLAEAEARRLDRRAAARAAAEAALQEAQRLPDSAQTRLVAERLRLWSVAQAWAPCATCGAVQGRAFDLAVLTDTGVEADAAKAVGACRFCRAGHVVPQADDFPAVLVGLRPRQLVALRPVVLHQGERIQGKGELIRHGGPTRLAWAACHVRDQVAALPAAWQERALDAFHFLCSHAESAYGEWVQRHEAMLRDDRGGSSLGPFGLLEPHVECALFPDLYPWRVWCESHGRGAGNYRSPKEAFLAKVCGPVQDYGLNYELIQFQFDRWVTGYFTARGAVGADTPLKWLLRRFPDAPQQNYATKSHVVDLHRQYGAAALFLTGPGPL